MRWLHLVSCWVVLLLLSSACYAPADSETTPVEGWLGTGFEPQSGGPLAIVSLTPKEGANTGGTIVTITGHNFASRAVVRAGEVAASEVWVWSATRITARMPALPSRFGSVPVTVENQDGQRATAADAFHYHGPTGLFQMSVLATGKRLLVVLGDFDADAKLDVLTDTTGGIQLLLNRGDGGFSTTPTVATGIRPIAALTGDFDADGRLDVIVANNGSNDVSVLLGDGQGGFRTANTLAPFVAPAALASADWNGDGMLDLAIGSSSGSSVSILRGNGRGGFGLPVNIAVDSANSAFVVGDWNADKLPDLLGGGRILLGDGAGSFTVLPSPPGAQEVAVADWNSDQKLDYAIMGRSKVDLYFGDGQGGFSPTPKRLPGSYTNTGRSLITVDFNRDQIPDLVVGHDLGVDVYLGDGAGNFAGPFRSNLPGGLGKLAAGDVNGDLRIDLLGIDVTLGISSVGVQLGFGDGQPTIPGLTLWDQYARPAAIGDFNGDRKLDAVYTLYANKLTIGLGNGAGVTFAKEESFFAGEYALSIQTADLNGDRNLDVVAQDERGGINLLHGSGTGRLSSVGSLPLPLPCVCQVAIGDWNGDARPDIIVLDLFSGLIAIFLNGGRGDFPSRYSIPAPQALTLLASDVSRDGKLDLIVGQPGGITIFFGNGSGGVQAARSVPAVGNFSALASGDWNGDGHTDLAYSDELGGAGILLADGLGSFVSTRLNWTSSAPSCIRAVDLDGDHKLDLMVNRARDVFGVFLGNGNGQFSYAQSFAGACPAAGDFTGDGRIDLMQYGQLQTNLSSVFGTTP